MQSSVLKQFILFCKRFLILKKCMILVRLSTYYVIPIATSETSGSTLNNRRTENAILLTFEPKKMCFLSQ